MIIVMFVVRFRRRTSTLELQICSVTLNGRCIECKIVKDIRFYHDIRDLR